MAAPSSEVYTVTIGRIPIKAIDTWPSATLEAINVSEPKLLGGERPQIGNHTSMLEEVQTLLSGTGTDDAVGAFGKMLGYLGPGTMRNGLLMCVYSPTMKQAFSLGPAGYHALCEWLLAHPRTNEPALVARIDQINQARDDEAKTRQKGARVRSATSAASPRLQKGHTS